MEVQAPFLILLVVTLLLLGLLYNYASSPRKGSAARNLPPSLPLFSLLTAIAGISWPSAPSLADINHLLHRLQASRGPITSLCLPFCTAVFISDVNLANQVLVNNGSAVSDRIRPSTPIHRHAPENFGVAISPYGEAWRSLRRNLVSGFVTPSSTKHFAGARRRVKEKLLERFTSEAAESAGIVNFRNNLLRAFYSLLVSMCFDRDLDDTETVELDRTMKSMISESAVLLFFSFLPRLIQKVFSKFLFSKNGGKHSAGILLHLLKNGRDHLHTTCYADTLLEFELPADNKGGGKRKLREDEILDLCAEFIGASGHNTPIALEWIMAELVNHPRVQGRLAEELFLLGRIDGDQEMTSSPYLRAVVMEGIRLHPPLPSFFRLVGKEFEVGGYAVPKGALVFFNAASMGVDERVWEYPLKFFPERFLAAGENAKLMAFGGGRRMCAGLESAVFILSYFVAHLVREFEWRPAAAQGGEQVDMSAKMEIFMPMKTPLRARIVGRINKTT
ncbi:Cytochrome P450 89A9 [Platanthera zijinensis]|uniref:Cytochrome P450 89A9 n=1 Tax=Platanthera zijinensis TaxID=2320716 RepID=A0AAP0G443_9ASPA